MGKRVGGVNFVVAILCDAFFADQRFGQSVRVASVIKTEATFYS